MGILSALAEAFGFRRKTSNVLVVGLDNSGKTTILNALKPARDALLEVAPTVGFTVERFQKGNLQFEAFDMSGASRFRSLWEKYYKDAQSIIFVVDSSDRLRIVVAKDELDALLVHPDIADRSIPVLVFANKTDVAGALPAVEVMNLLGLQRLNSKPWHIQATNALSGQGIDAGITWLAERVKSSSS